MLGNCPCLTKLNLVNAGQSPGAHHLESVQAANDAAGQGKARCDERGPSTWDRMRTLISGFLGQHLGRVGTGGEVIAQSGTCLGGGTWSGRSEATVGGSTQSQVKAVK